MATTSIDYRNPTILIVDDSQVTTANGVETVDLTVGAGGGLLAANNLSDVASAATSRTNLGGTATGVALFTAASAAAARTAIGATVTGSALITATNAAAGRTAIGAAATDLSNAAGVSTALGNYADDAAAALGGVAVGALYRNGSVVQVRVA